MLAPAQVIVTVPLRAEPLRSGGRSCTVGGFGGTETEAISTPLCCKEKRVVPGAETRASSEKYELVSGIGPFSPDPTKLVSKTCGSERLSGCALEFYNITRVEDLWDRAYQQRVAFRSTGKTAGKRLSRPH